MVALLLYLEFLLLLALCQMQNLFNTYRSNTL